MTSQMQLQGAKGTAWGEGGDALSSELEGRG